MTIPRFSSLSVSYLKPITSMVPGRKFWRNTSETLTRSRSTALPLSVLRLMARLFLPLLYCTQYALCPRTVGPLPRLSPPYSRART